MSKRGRAKKKRKQRRALSPQANIVVGSQSGSNANTAKVNADNAVTLSRNLFIRASAGLCFEMLAKQLEEPVQWDTMVIDVKPLSPKRCQVEATSILAFKLGRNEIKTLAMISTYRPNRAIAWISSDRPRVREEWTLEPEPSGTTIGITLSYDAPRWFVSDFLDRLMRRKEIERDINQMLGRFKEIAETSSYQPSSSK